MVLIGGSNGWRTCVSDTRVGDTEDSRSQFRFASCCLVPNQMNWFIRILCLVETINLLRCLCSDGPVRMRIRWLTSGISTSAAKTIFITVCSQFLLELMCRL